VQRQVRQLAVGLLLLAPAACHHDPTAGDPPPWSLDAKPDGEELEVLLVTRDGFHLNADYPVNFKTADGARTELKDTMKKKRCESGGESCSAQMRVPNQTGTLAFSVCSADLCRIEKVPLARSR
jgi:hypothetical protein